jgi:cardiolipin synthase
MTMANDGKRGYFRKNSVKLIRGGSRFFSELKELIDNATHSIHLQVYIFLDDTTGKYIGDALINARRRGVDIYLLVDGYGSRKLSESYIEELKREGIHFRFFHKLLQTPNFYVGRRLHHKVIVIDGFKALTCGANIADRYNDLPGSPAWLDLAIRIEGEVARALLFICDYLWRNCGGPQTFPPDDVDLRISSIPEEQHCLVRISRNDWVEKKMEISNCYEELIKGATETITIMCSYFLPGRKVRQLLKAARQRGVRVRAILSKTSDVPVFKHASKYLYRWMLRHGMEIYEYQKTVLHAKVTVADEKFLTIGSYNINKISSHASIELNLDVNDETVAAEAVEIVEEIIEKDCIPVTAANYHMGFLAPSHFPQLLSYLFIRGAVKAFTFYYTQKD